MNKNIILSGVGGQGILTTAGIIDRAATNLGLNVKQAEVHGMSQRGGAVQSHLRISSGEIFSDLIPEGKADVILSVEPMEALRYLPFLSPNGTIVTSTEPYVNIPDYPDPQKLLDAVAHSAKHVFVNAGSLAKAAGSLQSYNVVVLGAASPFLGIQEEELEKAIEMFFLKKRKEVININIKAFRLGLAYSLKQTGNDLES